MGWSDPCGLLATSIWTKVGSLQPSLVFCPRPNSSACRAQVMSSVWLRIGLRVNGSVNDRLNRAFRAPFTLSAASHVRKALEGFVEVSKLLLCSGCLVMWVQ